jgi:hypothetical protein
LRLLSLEKLPAALLTDVMTGMKMPAARDVVEGMAGQMRSSAAARPTASPSELVPHLVSSVLAMRSPRRVASKPRARKKDDTTSHTTVLLAAMNMSENVSACVSRPTVAPPSAHAPLGSGVSTKPHTTPTNSDSSCQACGGGGRSAAAGARVPWSCRVQGLNVVCKG